MGSGVSWGSRGQFGNRMWGSLGGGGLNNQVWGGDLGGGCPESLSLRRLGSFETVSRYGKYFYQVFIGRYLID